MRKTQLNVRLNDAEMAALLARSESLGVTVAEVLRDLIKAMPEYVRAQNIAGMADNRRAK